MSEQGQSAVEDPEGTSASEADRAGRRRNAIVLAVVVAFLVLVVAKLVTDNAAPTDTPKAGGSAGSSITSVHNDAVADYEAALATGKPVYVLFHSLSCEPCVEISRVADAVMPEYDGQVVFVNAITDDPSGQQLAGQFSFQYIPTSFFLSSDGTVVGTFTGAMSADEMRARLDALAGKQ